MTSRFFPFLALLKKELLQLLKNPKTRFVLFGPPVIQLFLLGYAATMDLKEIPLGVLDYAGTQESRVLVEHFEASTAFTLKCRLRNPAEMKDVISRRKLRMALVIPEDFSRNLLNGRTAPVQVIVDGRNSFSAGIASGYAASVIEQFNRSRNPDNNSGVRITVRGYHNPNYEAQYFMIPSLLANLTLLNLTLLVALSFAKEREGGTMDQLLLTPFSPLGLLAGKGIASILIGLAQIMFCMIFVLFWFRIPYMSAWGSLFLLFLSFLSAAVGIGLAVSVFCSNLQQAMIWTFIFAIPMAMLSGMTTPVASMPDIIQYAMIVNPIRWGINALHRLFLEGAGYADILPTCLILCAIGLGSFAFAAVSFTRQRRA